MTHTIRLENAAPRPIAAVRRRVQAQEIGRAWKPALDLVWDFLARHPGLRHTGHNLFLYHHPAARDQPMEVDFGVEVTGPFAPEGEVHFTQTPAGETATTLHTGPYTQLAAAHSAVHWWRHHNGKQIGGASWEIYGDWNADETKLETTIAYLLR